MDFDHEDFLLTDMVTASPADWEELVRAKADGTFALIVAGRDCEDTIMALTSSDRSRRWEREAHSIRVEVMNSIIARAVAQEIAGQ